MESYLILGTDASGNETASGGKYRGSMASTRLQLCTAHWYGGSRKLSCENTVDAVSRMLGGIPIQGYYSLRMDVDDGNPDRSRNIAAGGRYGRGVVVVA